MQNDKVEENIESKNEEQVNDETLEQEEVKAESEEVEEKDEVKVLSEELSEAKDKYLRLYSEFENFRRRTAKERIDLISTATKDLIIDLLPVMDDFERAFKSIEDKADASKEGLEIIHNKFKKILDQKGLKKMDIKSGDKFDPEIQEAITQTPAGKKLEGKVVDVIENGYTLNDKVIRFAKVVTGAKS